MGFYWKGKRGKKPVYFDHRGWNPHFSITVERTRSGVLKGTKPFNRSCESVQFMSANSSSSASFLR